MKRKTAHFGFSILLVVLATISCETNTDKKDILQENTKSKVLKDTTLADTTPRVTGIGGIFFESSDPASTRKWYAENLGLKIDDYGSPFEFRNSNNPEEINYLRWSPFEANSEYLKPSEKGFMINYRVQNMEGLVEKLKQNGVTILDTISAYEYGKFIHIMDTLGNKIKLWEPIGNYFTKMCE